jgi:hypothetical protein
MRAWSPEGFGCRAAWASCTDKNDHSMMAWFAAPRQISRALAAVDPVAARAV